MGTMETMGEQEQFRWDNLYLYENQKNLDGDDGDDGDDGRTRKILSGTIDIYMRTRTI